ncbi:MAG: hypothetical protein AB7T31_09845 [Gemmatimonadales bacterium]
MTSTFARRWTGLFVMVAAISAGSGAAAQQQPPRPTALPRREQEALPPLAVSPRGAMVRAMLVPGWGHAAIGAYARGGFYVALESLTAYTLLRTRNRLTDARERASFREAFVRASLAQEGVTDPATIDTRLDADDVLTGLRNLVSSRENQQEDLVAFGIFALFLTGADAFVSAHLARFPDPIEIDVSGAPDAPMELRVRVPLPR